MFPALNNAFNLKREEKLSKDRYKHVQIVKTCTNSKKELYSQCGRSSRSNWNTHMLASVEQG